MTYYFSSLSLAQLGDVLKHTMPNSNKEEVSVNAFIHLLKLTSKDV